MNATERVCFEWLKKKYNESDIVYQKGKLIRFITSDGKKWIVRRVYGNVVWFYKDQIDKIRSLENGYILLVTTTGVKEIPTKEISCESIINGIVVKCVDRNNQLKVIQVNRNVYKKLSRLKGYKDWSQFLEELVMYYERSTIEEDSIDRAPPEILSAIGILLLYKQKKSSLLKLLDKCINGRRLKELTLEEKVLVEDLLKWKLVVIDGSGNDLIVETVVVGSLEMNPHYQKLKVVYFPKFCRMYCSKYGECSISGKGGVRVWKLPLEDDLLELVRRVASDVCESE